MDAQRLKLVKKKVKGQVYWFAQEIVYDAAGQRKRITKSLQITGERRRNEAMRALLTLERTLLDRLDTPDLSVAQLVDRYLEARRGSIRQTTFDLKLRLLRTFHDHFGERAAASLTPSDVLMYRGMLAHLQPSTINLRIAAVRTVFQWGVKKKLLRTTPFTGDEALRIPRETFPAYLTLPQFETVLETVRRPVWRAGFALAMFAGLRKGEVLALRWSDISFTQREIRIESREGWETKSGHGRTVPMPERLHEILLAWHERDSRHGEIDARVIRSPHRGRNGEPRVHDQWKRRLAVVREDHPEIPNVTFHGLRHSYATAIAMRGVPIPTIQHMLGHASIQTTMIYAHVQPAIARDQVRAALDGAPQLVPKLVPSHLKSA